MLDHPQFLSNGLCLHFDLDSGSYYHLQVFVSCHFWFSFFGLGLTAAPGSYLSSSTRASCQNHHLWHLSRSPSAPLKHQLQLAAVLPVSWKDSWHRSAEIVPDWSQLGLNSLGRSSWGAVGCKYWSDLDLGGLAWLARIGVKHGLWRRACDLNGDSFGHQVEAGCLKWIQKMKWNCWRLYQVLEDLLYSNHRRWSGEEKTVICRSFESAQTWSTWDCCTVCYLDKYSRKTRWWR
jgi:hypothetical protein